MFCPTCGKENSVEIKFCASCGTNLDAISRALSGREEDFFTKRDHGMDHFIARYSVHVFTNSRSGTIEHRVARSWKLLGQAVITSFTDLLLFVLMCNFLPFRFLILLISTPFRLLSERNRNKQISGGPEEEYQSPELNEAEAGQLLPVPSVVEPTTMNLGKAANSKRDTNPISGQLD